MALQVLQHLQVLQVLLAHLRVDFRAFFLWLCHTPRAQANPLDVKAMVLVRSVKVKASYLVNSCALNSKEGRHLANLS